MAEKKEQRNKEEKKTQEKEIKDLVIARLRTMPSAASLSIGGGEGDFKAGELIDFVEKEDNKIGKMIIEIELNYIRSLVDLSLNSKEIDEQPSHNETSL